VSICNTLLFYKDMHMLGLKSAHDHCSYILVVASAFCSEQTISLYRLQQQQQQPFNGHLSGTTRVGRYRKKHSPAHTQPGQRTSFIIFLHLQRSTASSLFSLRAWQSSRTDYIIYIIYMHSNFVCGLSDVIIKTFSQSVSIGFEVCSWVPHFVRSVCCVDICS